MAITKTVSKTLEECVQHSKKEERIRALRENQSHALKSVLKCMIDPNIKFLLPEGNPPFKASQFDDPGRLHQDIRKFNIFVEGGQGYENVAKVKREMLFIDFLESLDPDEANLILHMKDKKSPFKNLTKDIAQAAFPELFPT